MEILIIPLIALVVWILQYVFKSPEEDKPKGRARPRNGGGKPRPQERPRRQTTDLDRFLEEARQRREKGEEPVVVAEVVPETPREYEEARERQRRRVPPPAPPPPRPGAPRSEQRPPRETTRSSPPRTSTPPLSAVPVVEVVADPPEKPARTQESPRARPQAAQAMVAATGPRTGKAFPMLEQILQNLSGPQGWAVALILREILDKPKSQRG